MAFNFTGKKILVTGAGSGIGRCLAVALSTTGCHVFAVSRTESTLASLKEECPSITTVVLDLSDWDETRRVLGQLDVMDGVVNNAAFYSLPSYSTALTVSKEIIDKHLATNTTAPINIIQIIAAKMISHGIKGSIVNVSSTGSTLAMSGMLSYNVSKAGLDMVTKQFALELGPNGIRVNSVNPGLVMTEFVKDQVQRGIKVDELFLKITPSGLITEPREVVGPILYLLSEHSSAVTGTTHIIDGGMSSSVTSNF